VAGSPFSSWNGAEPHGLFPGVGLLAIGGEQVLLCRVTYEPGTTVALHQHDDTEQVMAVLDGEMSMTIDGEQQMLGGGDVVVVNRGVPHELFSEGGCTFIEALSPVPRDHVPNPERDLVLGAQGDSLHVDK
jgi:quercetin dioxygenase-like cupin family protein